MRESAGVCTFYFLVVCSQVIPMQILENHIRGSIVKDTLEDGWRIRPSLVNASDS